MVSDARAREGTTPASHARRDTNARFVILGAGPHLLAVDAAEVEEMFVLGVVSRTPGAPPAQRGVLLHRDRTYPVLDVRTCLGLSRAVEQVDALVELLEARERDHRRWLEELEASVREARPFGLATDPRLCKFGQWFYAYKAPDVVVAAEIARFEEPHARIHALASTVAARAAEAGQEAALAMIEDARGHVLQELIALFDRTRKVIRAQHREIGVSVTVAGRTVVLAVDTAEAVTPLEPLAEGHDPVGDGTLALPFVSRLARWKERAQPVLVLDLPALARAAVNGAAR